MERRQLFDGLAIEKRDGQPKKITGYGAVFFREGDPATEYQLWQDTYERIMPGAFDEAIRSDDPVSLFNHDANFVLGRKSAGTLAISIDAKGLRYEVTPPGSQTIQDLVVGPVERGEIRGSSFMFRPTDVAWVEQVRDGRSVSIREIRSVKLYELGPVLFPAYEGTTTGLRSAGDVETLDAERAKFLNVRPMTDISVRSRWLEICEQAGNLI
jgi:HK97 family phage prohead protease